MKAFSSWFEYLSLAIAAALSKARVKKFFISIFVFVLVFVFCYNFKIRSCLNSLEFIHIQSDRVYRNQDQVLVMKFYPKVSSDDSSAKL